jgi:N-hydroxyarylamine O-acetyltransferase
VIASSFDQQAWLKRIGYGGPLEPTLSTLRQLIFAHSHAIAYESLDIMLARTPRLDVETLQRKMILGGRGGYCLEQNMLFRAGLRSLGYQITSLQGRVVRGMAIDAPRPAIHMLLQVEMPNGRIWPTLDSATSLPRRLSCFERALNNRHRMSRCASSMSGN